MLFRIWLFLLSWSCFSLALAAPPVAPPEGFENDPIGLRALEAVEGPDLTGKDGPMNKIGFDLARLFHEHREYQARGGIKTFKQAFRASNPALRLRDDCVLVDLTLNQASNDTVDALNKMGMKYISVYKHLVSGCIPVQVLDQLAGLDNLRVAMPSIAIKSSGAVLSQGDYAMYANTARSTYQENGTGFRIGTISDSYNCKNTALADVNSNDLPANVVVLADEIGCSMGTDEGRAMMQIIHDIAPGASQSFRTGAMGMADMANGIIELGNSGANIIVDDLIYLSEPMFQDGVIAQAVNQVYGQGVAYFSAAGNYYNHSYEAPFRDSGLKGNKPNYKRHDFDSGTGTDGLMTFTVPANTTIQFIVQWDDPFRSAIGTIGADTDLDLFIYNMNGTATTYRSTYNNINNDAFEYISITNSTASSINYQLAIDLVTGPIPGKIKLVYFGNMTINEWGTNSATLYGHANTTGAFAVGAARYSQTPAYGVSPPIIESYSSLGGITKLFSPTGSPMSQLLQKPDAVAPDGVDTTFFGSDTDGNGRPNFFGTSAAAPHAAALAALVWSFDPTLSVDILYSNLRNSTIDMSSTGFDYKTGYGLLHSVLSLQKSDTDLDLVANYTDNCVDVANTDQANFDGDTQGDACDLDDDNDGISDSAEIAMGSNPLNPDSDYDGLSDGDEVNMYGTSPILTDTDYDGLTDRDEVITYHMDPLFNDKGRLAPRGSPDTELNVADYLIQQRIILNLIIPTAIESKLADMNNDGLLNAADMLLLNRRLIQQ